MKAAELRIGNLVDVINRHHAVHMPYGFVKKIGEIHFFKVRLYEHDKPFAIQPLTEMHDIADLSLIPLTEQWLLKFGFQTDNITYSIDGGILTIANTKEGFRHLLFGSFTDKGVHLKSVHQLQNLYFALTGKELQVTS
jgi:hypothetical protein